MRNGRNGRLNGDEPQVRRALADAVRRLAADHVPLDAPIGRVQRWAGIPLPGCSGGEGCFNVVNATPTAGSGGATRPSSPDDRAEIAADPRLRITTLRG
ncbi:hypothetical protein A8W25_29065 [Streptomyces sp. ERV7]|uniref:hypothetical protein n=1 Tax=Streptomyces sp. ERV7 TaxID=1322334 RepID=UPI0007F3321F|nr:hypothetical protein [Streptomyces sp. ERV7]OAR23487.1 hypothetical protein A8W25_29065 [Streptomyces sp. ERV7]